MSDNTELPPEAEQILKEIERQAKAEEGKKVTDWLADFAREAEEALAKRAVETELARPPEEKALVGGWARKDRAEYDRRRVGLAKTLRRRVGTLDDKVGAARKKVEAEDDRDALPHWKVEPWSEPVDGAALLDSIKRVFRRY